MVLGLAREMFPTLELSPPPLSLGFLRLKHSTGKSKLTSQDSQMPWAYSDGSIAVRLVSSHRSIRALAPQSPSPRKTQLPRARIPPSNTTPQMSPLTPTCLLPTLFSVRPSRTQTPLPTTPKPVEETPKNSPPPTSPYSQSDIFLRSSQPFFFRHLHRVRPHVFGRRSHRLYLWRYLHWVSSEDDRVCHCSPPPCSCPERPRHSSPLVLSSSRSSWWISPSPAGLLSSLNGCPFDLLHSPPLASPLFWPAPRRSCPSRRGPSCTGCPRGTLGTPRSNLSSSIRRLLPWRQAELPLLLTLQLAITANGQGPLNDLAQIKRPSLTSRQGLRPHYVCIYLLIERTTPVVVD